MTDCVEDVWISPTPVGVLVADADCGLLDNFNDVNGTLLENHTPDIGGPWEKVENAAILGSFDIQDGCALSDAATSGGHTYGVLDVGSNLAVHFEWIVGSPTPADEETINLIFRGNRIAGPPIRFDTRWEIHYIPQAVGSELRLEKHIPGSTTVFSGAFAPSAGDLVKWDIIAKDSTIFFYQNGVLKNSIADTDNINNDDVGWVTNGIGGIPVGTAHKACFIECICL